MPFGHTRYSCALTRQELLSGPLAGVESPPAGHEKDACLLGGERQRDDQLLGHWDEVWM